MGQPNGKSEKTLEDWRQEIDALDSELLRMLNRRAEMWMRSREWLEDPAGAAVPDLDSLQADACGPTYTYDSNTRLKLEAKDHMRTRGVKSPDEWDAVALTFAEPVAPDAGFGRRLEYPASGVA